VRCLAIVPTLLGGMMPVAARISARLVTRRQLGTLDNDLTRIHAIAEAHPEPREATPLMAAVRMPTASWTTVL
jgi:hypothetical protein